MFKCDHVVSCLTFPFDFFLQRGLDRVRGRDRLDRRVRGLRVRHRHLRRIPQSRDRLAVGAQKIQRPARRYGAGESCQGKVMAQAFFSLSIGHQILKGQSQSIS